MKCISSKIQILKRLIKLCLLTLSSLILTSCSIFNNSDGLSCSDLVVTNEVSRILERLGDTSGQWRIINSDIEPQVYELEGNEIVVELQLQPAFPNPTDSEFVSSFTLPKEMHVEIILMNANGKNKSTIQNSILPSGRYDQRVNLDDRPNGCYKIEFYFDDSKELNGYGLIKKVDSI